MSAQLSHDVGALMAIRNTGETVELGGQLAKKYYA
jgi:hypothetical protein